MTLFPSFVFSSDIPSHVRKLLERIADYSKKGEWKIALPLSTIALEELEAALECDSRDIGLLLSVVGCINAQIDKYDDAVSVWRRAILILDKYDRESNLTVSILWNLVESLIRDEKYEEAEFFGRKSIKIHEKLHEIDGFQVAERKLIIGEVCLRLKKPDEAKAFFQAALPVYTRKFGTDSGLVEKIFELLETAYLWRNNIEESREFSDDIADATPLCSLGIFCENENFLYRALDYYKRAVDVYQIKGLSDHLQVANINLKLGKCYLKIDNCLGAHLHLDKSRAIFEKILANDDPVMLNVNIHLVFCYVKSGRLDEAVKVSKEILGEIYITDGSQVKPIVKMAEDSEESGNDSAPILNGKYSFISCALKILSALYVLDGKYRAAKILQDYLEME